MLRAPSRPPSERLREVVVERVLGSLARIPRSARPWLSGAVAAVAVAVIGMLLVAPLVRARVEKEAERRKLVVTVGSVSPGFFSATLRDVVVRADEFPGSVVRLDELRVNLGATLSVTSVRGRGGLVHIEGEVDDVVERLKNLRKGSGSGEGQASRAELAVEGITLEWNPPRGGALSGVGLRFSRAERTRFGCDRCEGTYEDTSLVAERVDGELPRVQMASLSIVRRSKGTPDVVSPTTNAALAEPAPPPLPVVHGKARSREKQAEKQVIATGPVLPLPDLHAIRQRVATAMSVLGPKIPSDLEVSIGGLSATSELGGESVTFGPAPFSAERRGDALHLSFASDGKEVSRTKATPLSLEAEVPLGTGDVTARLAGGPVSLALLGIKDGTKGLFDVSKGSISGKGLLVLSSDGSNLTFDGELALASLSIKDARLSGEALRKIDLAVSARGVLDDEGKLRLDDAEFGIGALHLRTHGVIEETRDHFALSLGAEIAPAACQSLVDSAPEGLLPILRTAKLSGTFGGEARLVFDTRTIDKLVLDYRIDDRCRVTEVPELLSPERFASSFTYRTYHPDGSAGETTTGPSTPAWTPIDDISPFMIAAVLTTEDGAFYKHQGFNHAAIKSSVAANLKARRFVRGASTISMQLAKNLFLSRDKTLSRKVEEVALTDYLEQVFRKDDLMELYLNVVEFGPDVYGVAPAAEYYFGRKPEELNVRECFFLATLLPSPIRYGRFREKGQVSETWSRYLTNLMEIAAKNGRISPAELAEGIGQTIAFHKDGEPKPEPRKPVTSKRRDPYEADGEWHPL